MALRDFLLPVRGVRCGRKSLKLIVQLPSGGKGDGKAKNERKKKLRQNNDYPFPAIPNSRLFVSSPPSYSPLFLSSLSCSSLVFSLSVSWRDIGPMEDARDGAITSENRANFYSRSEIDNLLRFTST